MLLSMLAFMAISLTCTMFATRQSMLGFACAIFWALTGAQAYTLSTVAWDIYFITAFACFLGMVTFCALGAFALREKTDAYGEQEMEQGDGQFIDEGKKGEMPSSDATHVMNRQERLHKRAEYRRKIQDLKHG